MFGHLHVHTDYSKLDGMAKCKELAERAVALGQTFIASTDHGSTSSLYDFQTECEAVGVKPILGCEFYTNSPTSERKSGHVIVFAKNDKGLEALFKLQEYAYSTGFKWKPRVNFTELAKYKGDIIVTSACLANTINQYIMNGDLFSAMSEIKLYQTTFGEDFYLELQSNAVHEQRRVNEVLLSYAKEFGIKTILANDVHYVLKDDALPHEVLLALQTNKKWTDPKRFSFPTTDFWLKSREEMYDNLEYLDRKDIDECLDNTQLIADKCNARITSGNYLPEFYDKRGKSGRELLIEEAKKGIIAKGYNAFTSDIQEEINVIDSEGLSDYFLIVQDYIRNARKNGVIVGDGRGSGAGSKLAYVMDIHRVQPDKYNLLFERFLAPGRTPDIDVDFSDQDLVFRDLQKKYGYENVAHIITFGRLTPKSVNRKVLSCFGHSQVEIKQINSCISETDKYLADALKRDAKLRGYKKKYPKEFSIIERLEGCMSFTGTHAGGILIMKDLTSKFPIITSSDDNRSSYTVAFDKKMVEKLGGWKFDVLGLETLPIIKRCLDNISANHGKIIDLYSIDYEDKKVYNQLSTGDVSGVFQLGAQGGKIMEQSPTRFDDLIAINALIRPGVGDWSEYIARRSGKAWSVHPLRMKYMSDTFGTMTYQEQYLLDAKTFAGWGIAYADRHLRKNKDIRNDVNLKQKFFKDCQNNNHDEQFVTELWQEIEDAIDGGYSFNKAHAASYGITAYQTAWLKHYYPVEWYASLMTSKGDDQDAINGLVSECKHSGINIYPPSINRASGDFVPSDGGISYRITTISHIGDNALNEVFKLRPIKSLGDILERRTKGKLNDRAIKMLIKAGTMDEFNPNRAELYYEFEMSQRKPKQIKDGYEPDRFEDNVETRLAWEKESLGIYLSAHPMDKYGFKPLDSFQNESPCFQGGEVMSISTGLQKNGKEMAFINLDSKFGVVRVLIFASNWADKGTQQLFQEGALVLVRGKRSGDSVLFNSGEELV